MNASEIMKVRKNLIELGVDRKLIDYIDQLSLEEIKGIYTFFLEIMEDELLFVIGLKDLEFTQSYLVEKEKRQPMGLN